MATLKQKAAVEKIVENHGNVSKAMKDVGYDLTTAKNPKNLTESKGYKELLEEYGLTEQLVTKALVEDIQNKPQKRILELNLGAEILGMKKGNETGGNKTLVLIVSGESAKRYGIQPTRNTEDSSK